LAGAASAINVAVFNASIGLGALIKDEIVSLFLVSSQYKKAVNK